MAEIRPKRGIFQIAIFMVFLYLSILSLYTWIGDRNYVFSPAKKEDLEVYSGRLRLIKQSKTSWFLLLETKSGNLKFSCGGPYGYRYWCGEVEKNEPLKNKICTIKSAGLGKDDRKLVYELSLDQTTVVSYDHQRSLFIDAYKQGPGDSQLFMAISTFLAAIYLFSLKKTR